MKYNVTVNAIDSLDEIPDYWTTADYRQLLELFEFPDAKSIKPENLLEMLQMAITDFEPAEAAKIILQYKLSEHLNDGQMDQMSHDMLLDKISEEYPNIALHYDLYNINQLLFKAFNGTFPNIKATRLEFSIGENQDDLTFTNSQLLRILYKGLSPSNLIVRMFEEQLSGDADFDDANGILWEVKTSDNVNFEIVTSDYWLGREDLAERFEAELNDIV